tara:strand:- start:234 stop:425 length:192 start_codon:yes stop_codon:yes gene_type:complete
MTKNKPQKITTKEHLKIVDRAITTLNNILGLYVEYNNDTKGFNRFLEEKIAQNKGKEQNNEES